MQSSKNRRTLITLWMKSLSEQQESSFMPCHYLRFLPASILYRGNWQARMNGCQMAGAYIHRLLMSRPVQSNSGSYKVPKLAALLMGIRELRRHFLIRTRKTRDPAQAIQGQANCVCTPRFLSWSSAVIHSKMATDKESRI